MINSVFDNLVYTTTISNLGTFEKHRSVFVTQLIHLSKYLPRGEHIQARGEATTTVNLPKIFRDLPGFRLLLNILMPSIEEARNGIFPNANGKLELIRGWANVMHKGSTTVSHIHDPMKNDPCLVCIFYLEAPTNSAQLVIIDDDASNLECVDFPSEKLHYIPVHPNMLVCHTDDVNHAVSEHLSDDRRISIMFEMKIVDDK